jgi:DNA-binding NtrC family response regulator
MARILLVDDEASIRHILSLLLTEHGHAVTAVGSGEAALDVVAAEPFEVVLLDMSLPGINGLAVLRKLRDRGDQAPCIVLTAHGTIRSAVEAVKAGAFDYLTKPFDNDELLIAIARAAEHLKLQTEVIALRAELKTRQEFSGIVATSALMRDVLRQMSRIAGDDGPVLILGESGTGKELVARGIHQQSSRNRGPFVAVNCSAIPAALVEAEFFGYERGAFTDAKETRPGKFEQADGGTLFLDEVGDLHIDAQAKLLRVLQEHVITRLGGRGTIAVNVRVVAATNHDLERAVKVGGFREDLFYRLNVLSLRLPPLRERGEDLSFLIEHFLGRLCAKTGASVSGISPEAMRLLLAHEWRGNVRELENVLHRAVVLAEGPLLRAADLPASVGGGQAAAADGASAYPLTLAASVERTVERVERALIQAALMETGGNQTAAADSLGINRKTLFNKLRLYGLAPVVESDES